MSNKIKYSFLFLIVTICAFSQNNEESFFTYSIYDPNDLNLSRTHKLILARDSLWIIQLPFGLYPEQRYSFSYTKKNNIIFIKKKEDDSSNKIGVKIKNSIIEQFLNNSIQIISENELLLLGENRPYYSEKYIKEITGNNYPKIWNVLIIDGEIISENSYEINELLEKYKRKVKFTAVFWKGKEAINKYGVKGLSGVFEITGKTKRSKKIHKNQ